MIRFTSDFVGKCPFRSLPFRSLLLCCVNLRRPQNRVPQFPVPLGTNSSAQSQGGSQASYGAGPERSERWTRCSESGRRRPAPRRRVTGHHGDWWGQNAERVFALRLSQTPPGLLSDRWGPSWDFGADTSLRSLWRSLGPLGEAPGVPAEDGQRATAATFEPVRGPQGEPLSFRCSTAMSRLVVRTRVRRPLCA